jgi:hypothetical protein
MYTLLGWIWFWISLLLRKPQKIGAGDGLRFWGEEMIKPV